MEEELKTRPLIYIINYLLWKYIYIYIYILIVILAKPLVGQCDFHHENNNTPNTKPIVEISYYFFPM